MKNLIYLALISLVIVAGCAKASDPLSVETVNVLEVEFVYDTVGIPYDMLITDEYVIVAEDQAGFSIFDKDSGSLKIRKTRYDDFSNFSNVRQLGYESDSDNLYVFDRYNPPEVYRFVLTDLLAGGVNYDGRIVGGQLDRIYEMKVSNDDEGNVVLAVAATNSVFRYGQIIEDIMVVDLYYAANAVRNFHLVDDYAYIAGAQRGLYIFDLNTRTFLSELNMTGEALDVRVKGDYAYIVAKQEGLLIADVSDKNNPVWLKDNSKSTVGWAQSIDIDGDYLVVGSGGGGIYVYDIGENPAEPKLLQRLNSNVVDYTLMVAIEGKNIYVAGRYKGISKVKINR